MTFLPTSPRSTGDTSIDTISYESSDPTFAGLPQILQFRCAGIFYQLFRWPPLLTTASHPGKVPPIALAFNLTTASRMARL